MISNLKNRLEETVIGCLVAILLLTSIVSWSKLISKKYHNKEEGIAIVENEAKEASSKLRDGVVVFAGFVIGVTEYFQMQDDK